MRVLQLARDITSLKTHDSFKPVGFDKLYIQNRKLFFLWFLLKIFRKVLYSSDFGRLCQGYTENYKVTRTTSFKHFIQSSARNSKSSRKTETN